jgi:hypothetical protein
MTDTQASTARRPEYCIQAQIVIPSSRALDMTGFGGAAFECQTTLVRLLSVAMHVPAAPEEVSLALDMTVMLPWSTPDNGA